MIDRRGRDALALGLRRLASGRLTNTDFDSLRLDSADDEALVAIGDAGWGLYDDFFSYRLRGRRALNSDALRAVARCVLFLDTDLPYEWPARRASLRSLVLTLLTLGHWLRRDRATWQATGAHEVWPFFRVTDYARAVAHPRRLSGGPSHEAA